MPAVIESTLYVSPGGAVIPGSTQQNSRDDVQLGNQIVLHSVHAAATYSWLLSFASDSPGSTVPGTPFDGTPSSASLLAPEGSTSRDAKFNVDYEGTYLIRLVVDAGLPSEDTQFIRARVLTMFGALKLIAAGERRDENGVIPVDASPEGWANDQNQNMQRVAILLRRLSHSGRILFVDSNRGRDLAQDQNDYENVISIPGPETARAEETGIKLRAMAHGDFSSINEAITYASDAVARGEPALSAGQPYVIVIRPGLYDEDLNLVSFIHLIGDSSVDISPALSVPVVTNSVIIRSVNAAGTGTHRYNPGGPAGTDEVFLFNLVLQATSDSTQPCLDVLGGRLHLGNVSVVQAGDAANQGEALRCSVADGSLAPSVTIHSSSVVTLATTASRVALRFDANAGSLFLVNSQVLAEDCHAVVVNASLYEVCSASFLRSVIRGDVGYIGYASYQGFTDSTVIALGGGPDIEVTSSGAGAKAGDVAVGLFNTVVGDLVSFWTEDAAGTTSIELAGLMTQTETVTPIVYPDAPDDVVDTVIVRTLGETVRYNSSYAEPLLGIGGAATVPVANRIAVKNVQSAIDRLINALFPITGSPFYSLGSAYNGLSSINPPTLGTGLGRNIAALGGAVQVQGATAPLMLDHHAKHGGVQVEGVVDIGGFVNGAGSELLAEVGHSEIFLNPNMMGAGPFIALGRAAWSNGISGGNRGFGGAVILADQGGLGESFNLHLRTASGRTSSTGGNRLGNVYIAPGSQFVSAGTAIPGDTHILGGSTNNVGQTPGSVFLAPGRLTNGARQEVVFVGGDATDGSVPASLVAADPYDVGVAGTIAFGTPNGVELFTFSGGENLAAAVVLVNATAKGFTASISGGTRLALVGTYDPTYDIVYLGDTVGGDLNTALGNFIASAATFTPGTYGWVVGVDIPALGRLRIKGDLEYTGSLIPAPSVGSYKAVTAGLSPYTTAVSEDIFGARLEAGSDIVVNLHAGYAEGATVKIKDENFLANGVPAPGGQKITITDDAGGDIEGGASYSIIVGGGAVTLYKNDTGNWFIY